MVLHTHRMSTSEIERHLYITNNPLYRTIFIDPPPIPSTTLDIWNNASSSSAEYKALEKTNAIQALSAKKDAVHAIESEIDQLIKSFQMCSDILELTDTLKLLLPIECTAVIDTIIKKRFGGEVWAKNVVKRLKNLENLSE